MKFRFLAYLLVFTLQLQAQQRHYILLQTETGLPFKVKFNEKIYQSSTAGHVIIPRLISNRYNLELNMNHVSGSYFFSCVIKENDLAYTVVDYGVKGWGLRDMHTKEVMLAATEPIKDAGITGSSVFTDMLMEVADDTSLNKQMDIVVPIIPETVNNNPVVNDHVTNDADTEIQQTIDSVSRLQALEEFVDSVELREEKRNENLAKVDTMTNENLMTVPFEDIVTADTIKQQVVEPLAETKPAVDTLIIMETPASEIFIPADTVKPVLDNPFYKPDNKEPREIKENKSADNVSSAVDKAVSTAETATQAPPLQEPEPVIAVQGALRPGCKEMYPDDGIEKLKRKVVTENSIESMVQVILKATNNKCLTTAQVKSLGGLFLSDDGRYTLYDALYSRVYDYGMYSALEKQIVDPYYKKRFLALLR